MPNLWTGFCGSEESILIGLSKPFRFSYFFHICVFVKSQQKLQIPYLASYNKPSFRLADVSTSI